MELRACASDEEETTDKGKPVVRRGRKARGLPGRQPGRRRGIHMKKWLCTQLVLAASVVALAPGAQAAEPVSLGVANTLGITWVEATVADPGSADLKVVILGPRKDGRRQVFQTCRFPSATAGAYRCGFDSSDGSSAARWEGTWKAKAVSSGVVLDRASFQL